LLRSMRPRQRAPRPGDTVASVTNSGRTTAKQGTGAGQGPRQHAVLHVRAARARRGAHRSPGSRSRGATHTDAQLASAERLHGASQRALLLPHLHLGFRDVV
jgi:hypothetical protein